jgi:predicted membrane protein
VPTVPATLAGAAVVFVLFTFCVLWTVRVGHSERIVWKYGIFPGNVAAVPGMTASAQAICSLTSLQFLSKESQPIASAAPIIRTVSAAKPMVMAQSLPPADSQKSAVLDSRRLFALGAIETGNNDNEIGQAGEVSRYQIMPSVWKHYSHSSYYENPQVSRVVAQQHWSSLRASFKNKTGREPDNFDMYVMWNTCYGYYASKGFRPARLDPVVRDRAQRFVNLVERGES